MMKKFNLTNIKPLTLIIAGIGIVALILLMFVVINSFQKSRSETAGIYKPSPIPSLKPVKLPQAGGFEEELTKIKSILPYSGQNFTIRYRQAINTLDVEIQAQNREDFVKSRQEAEDFLKSKGVADLCVLNIFWETPENSFLYKDLQSKDILTTGCPVSPKRNP